MNRIEVPAMLAIAWYLLMAWLLPYPAPPHFHHDVQSPVIALQLIHNCDDLRQIIPPGDPHRFRLNTWLDFVFIAFYVWYFCALDPRVTRFALLTALFDVIENVLILIALQGHPQPIYIASCLKWSMLAITLIAARPTFYSLATARVTKIAFLYSAFLLLGGVLLGSLADSYAWIESGAAMFGATLLIPGLYLPILLIRRLLPPHPPVRDLHPCGDAHAKPAA